MKHVRNLALGVALVMGWVTWSQALQWSRVHTNQFSLVQATNASAALTALGAGVTGIQILAATNQAQAQSVIGASGSAQMLFGTSDPPAAPPSSTNSGAIAFSATLRQYVWSTNAQAWDFFGGRGAVADAGTPYTFAGRASAFGVGADWWAPYWTTDTVGAYSTNTATDVLAPAGTFTGETSGWVPKGSNTVDSSGDRLNVTYVNDANGAEFRWMSSATNLTEAVSTNAFYRVAFDAYRSSGSSGTVEIFGDSTRQQFVMGASSSVALPATNSWYEMFYKPVVPGGNIWLRFAGMGAGSGISLDNLRVEKITTANMLALNRTSQTNASCVRAAVVLGNGYQGLITRADAQTDPTKFIAVLTSPKWMNSVQAVGVYTYTSGAWAEVTNITYPVTTMGYEATVEAACTGSSLEVRVDGHLRYTGTVPSGWEAHGYHGMLSTGGSGRVVGWSLSTPTEAASQACPVFILGGSLTSGTTSYAHYTMGHLLRAHVGRRVIVAHSGFNGYSYMNHLPIVTQFRQQFGQPSAVILDLWRNHADTSTGRSQAEGLIRHLRRVTTNTAAILSWRSAYWTASGGVFTTNQTDSSRVLSMAPDLCTAYGIPLADFYTPEWEMVVGLKWGATVHDCVSLNYTYSDGLHPNTAGQYWRAGQLLPYLTDGWVRGVHVQPATVPVQATGSEYWETCAPTYTAAAGGGGTESAGWADGTATAYTHTWPAVTATPRVSSTAGATITVVYTGRCFVLWWPRLSTTLEYQVDGSAWRDINHVDAATGYHAPLGSGGINTVESATGPHTVVIRVKTTGSQSQVLGWWTL